MKRKLLFLIGIMSCLGNTYAQSGEAADAQKQDEKAIQSLTEEVKERDKTIEKLNLLLEKLEAENEQLDSALQAEIKEGKAAKYKKQIKQLQKDSLALSERMEEVLEEMSQEHQKRIDIFADQHKKDSLDIVALREELKGLEDFRVKWLAQLAESVDEKWLNKPYAAVDVAALEKDYDQYEQYAPMDAKVAEAKDKLTPFVANARLYQRGKEAVDTIYNAEVVNPLIEPMRAFRDSLPEGNNRDDVDKLYMQLNDYAITIEIFQDVINAVNKVLQEMVGKLEGESVAGAGEAADAILKNQEKEYENISAIKMIPWLAKRYGLYEEALLNGNITQANEIINKTFTLPQ